jgi:hypothetical protein
MEGIRHHAMLATLGGILALLLGLGLMALPLLAQELSRPRDALWGAVVLLLGLVLVTSSDRLVGSPMLAVLCGGLLIGRLGSEVALARWRVLSPEEQQRLWSLERWQTSLQQLLVVLGQLLTRLGAATTGLIEWVRERRAPRSSGKRWVRQEEAASPAPGPEGEGAEEEARAAAEAPPEAEAAPAGEVDLEPAPEEPAPQPQPDEGPAAEPQPNAEAEAETQLEPEPEAQPVPACPDTAPEENTEIAVVQSFEEVDALLRSAPEPPEAPAAP